MSEIQTAVSVGAVLLLLGMAIVMFRRGTPSSGANRQLARNRDGTFEHVCSMCGDQTLVTGDLLHTLSSAEKALAVRENRAALGKDLAEYVCRQCYASHCFAHTPGGLISLGVNLYEGQRHGTRCAECLQPVQRPTWEPGYYDGRVDAAPGLVDSCGLACHYCGAVCCVGCCQGVTRKRTQDGSLLCPRCFRGPNDCFFHP